MIGGSFSYGDLLVNLLIPTRSSGFSRYSFIARTGVRKFRSVVALDKSNFGLSFQSLPCPDVDPFCFGTTRRNLLDSGYFSIRIERTRYFHNLNGSPFLFIRILTRSRRITGTISFEWCIKWISVVVTSS